MMMLGRPTSTSASEPAATNPTFTGKKASASPSHLNSRDPVGFSESIVSIDQIKAFRSARQSASPVTDGSELGLLISHASTSMPRDSRDGDGNDDIA
jgi:hypothetical protein